MSVICIYVCLCVLWQLLLLWRCWIRLSQTCLRSAPWCGSLFIDWSRGNLPTFCMSTCCVWPMSGRSRVFGLFFVQPTCMFKVVTPNGPKWHFIQLPNRRVKIWGFWLRKFGVKCNASFCAKFGTDIGRRAPYIANQAIEARVFVWAFFETQ